MFCFCGQARNHCFSRTMTERGGRVWIPIPFHSVLVHSSVTAMPDLQREGLSCLPVSARLCQSLCHITSLARDGGTLQSLEEFSSVTLFPYKLNSNLVKWRGCIRGGFLFVPRLLADTALAGERTLCVGL